MKTALTFVVLTACGFATQNFALALDHTKDSLDKIKQNVSQQKALIVDVRE